MNLREYLKETNLITDGAVRHLLCSKIPDAGDPGACESLGPGESKEDPRGISECRSKFYPDEYFCGEHRDAAGALSGS